MINNISKSTMFFIGSAILTLIVIMSTIGINDNGWRTVVQWPNGTTFVKFTPGVYLSLFGTTESYPDEMTLDYEGNTDGIGTMVENGISVRYQDGGTGTTYGKLRVSLPTDEPTMLKLHRSVRSADGVANRILRPTVKEAHNMTAGLMTSEEAYAEKRGIYIQWVEDQLRNGKYQTELREIETTNEAGQVEKKQVPVIKTGEANLPLHTESVFTNYGIIVSQSPIVNWDFEKKTLDQISAKRNATMAIITAKAEAERAKQDAITAEEQGKAKVMEARYQKEQEKIKAVVDAEKSKEVAVIDAEQKVAVAEQQKLEQEQLKLAAYEEKKRLIALGEGEATRKKLVMQADGALQQKLATYEKVNARYAEAIGKNKLVPEVVMGAGAGGAGNNTAATDLINMLSVRTAKELSLDMSMKGK